MPAGQWKCAWIPAEGPLAATVPLKRTDRGRGGHIQIYSEATADVSPDCRWAQHDVYLVFRSTDDRPVGEFEFFRFEQYRGDIGVAKRGNCALSSAPTVRPAS